MIIQAGEHHSLVINNKNKTFFWGNNNYSQCGISSSGNQNKIINKFI